MIRQLSARELSDKLAGPAKPVVLDVREPWELAVCQLPGTVNIPMGQIPVRVEELPKDAEIVVMCHHGVRSQHVALFLQSQGFDKLCNLKGGIAAWSREVDPKMPTY
jgi:rhodanese-related sulfurtransferase